MRPGAMYPMDREKLKKNINEADLSPPVRDLLLLRLKVASHTGVAAVVRDFQIEIEKRRIEVLPSHRRFFEGKEPSPRDKKMITLNTL